MTMVFKLITAVCLVAVVRGMPTLLELAQTLNETQFISLINQASLENTLKTGGPYTILAPTDAAFAAIPKTEFDQLKADPAALANVLKYHIIQGEIFSWDLVNGRILNSMTGHAIRVYQQGNNIYFNNAKAVKLESEGINGVIYLVDTVLDVPEGTIFQILERNADLAKFLSTIKTIRYDHLLNTTYTSASNRFTVFAPTDQAFAKLDKAQVDRILGSSTYASQLVRYHIHRGTIHVKSLDHNGQLSTMYAGHYIGVDTSNNDIRLNHVAHIDITDIEADNGVVHVIDHVLIPSSLSGQLVG